MYINPIPVPKVHLYSDLSLPFGSITVIYGIFSARGWDWYKVLKLPIKQIYWHGRLEEFRERKKKKKKKDRSKRRAPVTRVYMRRSKKHREESPSLDGKIRNPFTEIPERLPVQPIQSDTQN